MSIESTWRAVPGFLHYEVNIDGHIRSNTWRSKGKLLKPWLHKGYMQVSLWRGGEIFRFGVHQLVLLAFHGPCPNGLEGCHNNGIKTDNRADNLRWDTHANNYQDQIIHGTAGLLTVYHASR